jgi:hypothetical protein
MTLHNISVEHGSKARAIMKAMWQGENLISYEKRDSFWRCYVCDVRCGSQKTLQLSPSLSLGINEVFNGS